MLFAVMKLTEGHDSSFLLSPAVYYSVAAGEIFAAALLLTGKQLRGLSLALGSFFLGGALLPWFHHGPCG